MKIIAAALLAIVISARRKPSRAFGRAVSKEEEHKLNGFNKSRFVPRPINENLVTEVNRELGDTRLMNADGSMN